MKKIIVNNIRLIITCFTLIAITSIMCFSYAYGSGTNTIYTRDELSEKIDLLTKNGRVGYTQASSLSTIKEAVATNYELCNSTDESLFSCNANNNIIINRTGRYNITTILGNQFSNYDDFGYIYLVINNVKNIICLINSASYTLDYCNTNSFIYLHSGDVLSTIFYIESTAVGASSSMVVEYVNEL